MVREVQRYQVGFFRSITRISWEGSVVAADCCVGAHLHKADVLCFATSGDGVRANNKLPGTWCGGSFD